MNFITAAGYYRDKFQPTEVEKMSAEEIEGRMHAELTEGIEGTDIRAGVMGELGTTEDKIFPTERKTLIAAGFGHKVIIGNDICMKMRLHKYGGWGYDHIITNLFPYMRTSGISDEQLRMLFNDNPARFLDNEQS
jgi:predicted metal-dependent phosphotriesterase family hydrolase